MKIETAKKKDALGVELCAQHNKNSVTRVSNFFSECPQCLSDVGGISRDSVMSCFVNRYVLSLIFRR